MATAVHVRWVHSAKRSRQARHGAPAVRGGGLTRSPPRTRSTAAPLRTARGISVLVSGSYSFAVRMVPRLGRVPGLSIAGHSRGDDMSKELANARWPDVVIVDAEVGLRLGTGNLVPELRSRGPCCAVVMILDGERDAGGGARPIRVWPHWSVLLEESTTSPVLLARVVQGAARGGASIDRSIDQSLIEYLAVEPIPTLSLIAGLRQL